MEKKDLTKKQLQVVTDVYNGALICCDSDYKGAWISGEDIEDYHINNGVFFRLLDKKAIYQQFHWPFDYVLTKEAKNMFN